MSAAVRARLGGLFLLVLGVGMVGYNLHTIAYDQTFSWKFFVVGGAGAALGPLLILAGRPVNPDTGHPVLWWNIASGILGALGAGLGAWYSYALTH
jgi:hypothetical protein